MAPEAVVNSDGLKKLKSELFSRKLLSDFGTKKVLTCKPNVKSHNSAF